MTLPALEDCKPGFYPVEYNVLIAAEGVVERSAGGIIIPPKAAETTQAASMKGLLVAVSALAFDYAEWPSGSRKPQVGDIVLFAKYAGVLVTGDDGRELRACKDRDIIAVYQGVSNV